MSTRWRYYLDGKPLRNVAWVPRCDVGSVLRPEAVLVATRADGRPTETDTGDILFLRVRGRHLECRPLTEAEAGYAELEDLALECTPTEPEPEESAVLFPVHMGIHRLGWVLLNPTGPGWKASVERVRRQPDALPESESRSFVLYGYHPRPNGVARGWFIPNRLGADLNAEPLHNDDLDRVFGVPGGE